MPGRKRKVREDAGEKEEGEKMLGRKRKVRRCWGERGR